MDDILATEVVVARRAHSQRREKRRRHEFPSHLGDAQRKGELWPLDAN
jgi:hypothetical protein